MSKCPLAGGDDDMGESIGLSSAFSGEYGQAAYRDLNFGLIAMGQDPNVPEADRQSADAVLTSIQAQRQPSGPDKQ